MSVMSVHTTRRRALQFLTGALAAATASSLLAACQRAAPAPTSNATTSGPATTSAGQTANPAPEGPPVQGGKIVIGQDADPIHLDVQKNVNLPSTEATEHIYDSLTVFDENMNIQPSLAESWDTPDPTTYIFHLRKGVKWHNGREFVASDVAYWFSRIMDPKTAASQRGNWAIVNQLDTPDNYTVKLSLSKPSASLLALFATMRESAMPNKETVEQYGDLATHAVGTGPYKLAEFVPGNHVRYVRNPDYWGKPLPYIDEITLNIMVDEEQRIAALRTGQVHLALLSPIGAQRVANEKSFAVRSSPEALLFMVVMNTQRAPYTDVRVRKAMSMAIDRKVIIDKAVQGAGVLTGPTPTGHGDWYVPVDQLPYKQDLQGAKKLLAEAGYPDGFKTTISTVSQPPAHSANAVELKNQLKDIGVDVTIKQFDPGALGSAFCVGCAADKIGDFDMVTTNFTFYPGPDTYVGNFLPERNAITRGNDAGMKNPQITDLLTKAEATQDHEMRKQLYLQAQLALMDIAPALWLYAVNQIDGTSNSLKGYKQSFTGRRYLIRSAWMGTT